MESIIDKIENIKMIIKRCEGDITNNINSHSKLSMYNEKLEELKNSEEYKNYLKTKEEEVKKIKLLNVEKVSKRKFDLAEKNSKLNKPRRYNERYSIEEIKDIFENVGRKDWDKMREYAEKYERPPTAIQFATDIINRENEGEDCSFSGISSICRKVLNKK